jgi:hypothetical protein
VIRDAAPEQWQFAVVRVTGPYGFNVAPGVADYGHLLPVELLVEPIDRHDSRVSGPLRAALRNRTRLWRIDGVSGDIEAFVGGGEHCLCVKDGWQIPPTVPFKLA